MNGWLVVARCPMDEIPLALERTEVKATQLARALSEGDCLAAAKKLGLDTSSVASIAILEFHAGRPVGTYKIVQDLT